MSRRTPSHIRTTRRALRHFAKKHPDRSCDSGKIRYRDHAAAVSALHSAATARHFAELAGNDTRRRESRIYGCAMCQGFHLTSMRELPAA